MQMPPLFGEAEPLLRFSAKPNRFFASPLRRCLRFSAKPNRFFASAMPPLFGEAEPLLRFSAKPNRFFASASAEPMPTLRGRCKRNSTSLRLRRSRCLRFAGDANETQLRFSAKPNRFFASAMPPLFGEAEPLLRFSAKPNRFFASASAEPMPTLRGRCKRNSTSLRLRRSRCLRFAGDANETQLRFGEAYASPLLRFGFGGADADAFASLRRSLRFAGDANETQLRFGEASASPLLRFGFGGADANAKEGRCKRNSTSLRRSLRFSASSLRLRRSRCRCLRFASPKPPLLRFFASASAEPMPMRRKGDANFYSLHRMLRLRLRRSRCQCEGRAMQTFILCIACFGFGGADAFASLRRRLHFASAKPMRIGFADESERARFRRA
uniref:Uncharacterized protein n=1 Tax=Hydrodictyon reticulatum TaxID=3107 RepID=A0A1W5RND1_HYDRE|nr:hypothetical protein [Hydrodictyon reticulatum]YP_009364238.1 hypothetical protein [Hydrodictyon reticulatum]AQU64521.1 hypothetical protein [Hydrodictyon reticulatum]AQU64522.1 hypothetical protein [Hydrodictyon reticulatum]